MLDINRRRVFSLTVAMLGAVAAIIVMLGGRSIMNAAAAPISGTCSVIVADNTQYATCSVSGTQFEYIGDQHTTFGSAGTGTFNSFVRLQGAPTERGYNTDGTLEFDSKSGTWTHAIKVSEIPVVSIGGQPHWELWADINDSNSTPQISLDDLEIWFTSSATITGYPFSSGASKEYDFSGAVQINDVNQGSGRGDLRVNVPLSGITIPANCGYGDASCTTYFVLYSKWGGNGSEPFASDGGFEEWKVKQYPTLQIRKIAQGGNGTFTYTVTGPGTPLSPSPSITTSGGTGQTQVYIVDPGSFTISEQLPAGWSLVGASCAINGGTAFAYSGGSITLTSSDHLICTYTNAAPATLTIVKDAVPNAAQDFAFTTTGTGPAAFTSGFSEDDDADGTLPNSRTFTFDGSQLGAKTVTEGTTSGWTLTNLVCSSGTVNVGTRTASVTLASGDAVTCTFTNTKDATLTVVKDAVPNNAQDFAFTTTGTGPAAFTSGFSEDDDADGTLPATRTFTFDGTQLGAKTVTESLTSGWTLTNLVCSAGTVNIGTRTASVTLAAGDAVTCTFTNTQDATLTIVKDAVPNDAQDFAFTTTGTGPAAFTGGFSEDDDADGTLPATRTFTFGGSQLGAKTVTEGVTSGWTLTNLVCSAGTVNIGTRTASVTLAAGDAVTCTYTNTKDATLTIVKDAVPNDAQDFAFTTTGTGPAGFTGGFSEDDDADGTLPATRTFTFDGTQLGAKTVVEGVTSGWTLTNLVCSAGTVNIGTRTASVTLAAGDAVTCTYTNTKNATLTIVKDAVPNDAQDFAFTTTGTGPAGFTGGFSEDDDADGTLPNSRTFTFDGTQLGAKTVVEGVTSGWTLTNLVCTAGTVNIGTRTASVTLAAGDAVTCTYTNTKLPTIIVRKATSGGTGTFPFSTTGGNGLSASFNLTTVTAGTPVSQSFQIAAAGVGGTFTVTEGTLPANWAFTGVGCEILVAGAGGTTLSAPSSVNKTATITNLAAGATVQCTYDNSASLTTRTQGFWATHPEIALGVWNGTPWYPGGPTLGPVADHTLCGFNISDGELMAGFWSNIAKTSTGDRRTSLEQARMKLLQQLLAAILNNAAFGSAPGGSISIQNAKDAYCGTNVTAINNAAAAMAAFNESGDTGIFTPGVSADAKLARSIAEPDIPSWDDTMPNP